MSKLLRTLGIPFLFWICVIPAYAGWVVDGDPVVILRDIRVTSVWTEVEGRIYYDGGAVVVNGTNVTYTNLSFEVHGDGRFSGDLDLTNGMLFVSGTGLVVGASVLSEAGMGNWDAAYGWGDHGAGGYLTAEVDPLFSNFEAVGGTIEGSVAIGEDNVLNDALSSLLAGTENTIRNGEFIDRVAAIGSERILFTDAADTAAAAGCFNVIFTNGNCYVAFAGGAKDGLVASPGFYSGYDFESQGLNWNIVFSMPGSGVFTSTVDRSFNVHAPVGGSWFDGDMDLDGNLDVDGNLYGDRGEFSTEVLVGTSGVTEASIDRWDRSAASAVSLCWSLTGNASGWDGVEYLRTVPVAGVIQEVWMSLGERGNDGQTRVDLLRASPAGPFTNQATNITFSSLYTTNWPALDGLSASSALPTRILAAQPDVSMAVSRGDVLRIDILEAGATGAENLTVEVVIGLE
jgi:hypothetical protein